MLKAVIGIGSNSTRLLVGEVENGKITGTQRLREGTRLFAGLDDGMLSAQSMMRTADAVARFAKTAYDAGVAEGNLHILATSAARDAKNGAEFAEMVEALCGVPLAIITGEEEARLSFIGGAGVGYSGLVDIGGGSTEIATGGGSRPFHAVSVQLGAVRLFGEVPMLSGDGLERAYALARERIEQEWTEASAVPPAAWYMVGGTGTCLASIDMQLAKFDRDAVDGHALGRKAVENWARRLAKLTAEERAALPGMLPTRADIIGHGAVILWALMDSLGLERIIVSNKTNLDGYLLDQAASERDSIAIVRDFYDASVEKEWERLEKGYFEFAVNKHFIDRYVKPGDRVLDAGGGPGRYTMHLAGRGAKVTLLDLSPGNVAFAKEKAKELGVSIDAVCCDARVLDEAVEGQFDVVLLMGPLYHLLEEADRVSTVQACLKKLKPGGVLCVAFISVVGGLVYSGRELPESIIWENQDVFYQKIIDREDYAGTGFTRAFFIEPSHVEPFMAQFPLEKLHMVNSESVTAPFHTKIMASEPAVIEKWLELAIALSEREDFRSFTEHFLYIGRKREGAQ